MLSNLVTQLLNAKPPEKRVQEKRAKCPLCKTNNRVYVDGAYKRYCADCAEEHDDTR